MGNIFNDDFRDFLTSLNKFNVRYVLVGGFSVILHGYARTTGDMDIWVDRTEPNYRKLERAFNHFGLALFDMTLENFLTHPKWDVFTFGVPPVAIDIMVKVKGLDFDSSFNNSVLFKDGALEIRTIHLNDLLITKEQTGRLRDLDDLNNLSRKK